MGRLPRPLARRTSHIFLFLVGFAKRTLAPGRGPFKRGCAPEWPRTPKRLHTPNRPRSSLGSRFPRPLAEAPRHTAGSPRGRSPGCPSPLLPGAQMGGPDKSPWAPGTWNDPPAPGGRRVGFAEPPLPGSLLKCLQLSFRKKLLYNNFSKALSTISTEKKIKCL